MFDVFGYMVFLQQLVGTEPLGRWRNDEVMDRFELYLRLKEHALPKEWVACFTAEVCC